MALKSMNMGGGGAGGLAGLFSGGLGKTPKLDLGGMFSALAGALAGVAGSGGTNQVSNYKHKYKVSSYQVLIPGEKPVDMPKTAINKIIITKLFDECLHPIMEIHTMLPPKLYDKIINNKNTAKIRMRLQMEAYDCKQSKVGTDDYINDQFSIYTEDEAKFKEEPNYDKANENSSGNYNVADYNTEYILSLWSETALDAMCQVVNAVYNNCTLSTALGKIYGSAGIQKILISPMDNQNSYAELKLPPMNLMNVVDYMEKVYGTYYTGTQQFFDYRCLYIMSKNGVCDAFEKGEFKRTIFVVPKANKEQTLKTGTAKDSKAKVYYVFLEPDSIGSSSPASLDNAIEGNNLTIVDSRNNETMQVEGAGQQRGGGNQRVITDNYSNDFNKSTALTDINEKNKQMNIEIQDYNQEAFTPNKEFLVVFEDTKLSGDNGFYRLVDITETYSKKGDQLDAVAKVHLVFKSPLSGDEAQQILASVIPKSEANSMTQRSADTSNSSIANMPQAATAQQNANRMGKVDAPVPRVGVGEQESVIDTNKVTPRSTPKNPNYSYDDLGNVQGANVPSYNMITPNDSASVVEAKKQAQAKCLPCEGPKPRQMAG